MDTHDSTWDISFRGKEKKKTENRSTSIIFFLILSPHVMVFEYNICLFRSFMYFLLLIYLTVSKARYWKTVLRMIKYFPVLTYLTVSNDRTVRKQINKNNS